MAEAEAEKPKRGGWAAALLEEDEDESHDEGTDGLLPPMPVEHSSALVPSSVPPPAARALPVASLPAAAPSQPAVCATAPAMYTEPAPPPGMPMPQGMCAAAGMPQAPPGAADSNNPVAMQMLLQQVVMTMACMQAIQEGPGIIPPAISSGAQPSGGSVAVSIANLEKAKQYQRLAGRSGGDQRSNNSLTVFIGGLRKTTDEDQVFSHFSKYGEVEQVDIKRNPNGDSRGFAFVRFANEESLERVLEQKSKHIIDNKWIDVKRRDNIAANAGRAAGLAKTAAGAASAPAPEPKDEVPDEEEFTSKYLALSQQVGQRQEQEAVLEQMKSQGMVPMMPMMVPVGGCMGGKPGMGGPQMMMMGGMQKGSKGGGKKNGAKGSFGGGKGARGPY